MLFQQYPAVAVVITLTAASSVAFAAPPAFEGAEGFAAEIDGGRGGDVIKVTTLAASGPGSLQAALDTPGPRIVVFEVSGVIDADVITIPHGDLTIAGQTAPGGGITIAGRLWAEYDDGVDDIIVRHVRVRPSADTGVSGAQMDSVRFSLSERVLLDHVSISYGVDESLDMYEAKDVTVQWSTIERAATTGHPEGVHAYGMINGPDGHRISVHHNFFAHNKNRNPAIANGPAEIVNNVVYDVRHGFIHHNPASGQFNIVGNTFVRGPASQLIPFYFDDEDPGGASYHLRDNAIDDPGEFVGVVDDPFTSSAHSSFDSLGVGASAYHAGQYDFGGQGEYLRPVAIEPSSDAYHRVVACAGAFPRDVVTTSSFADLASRSGSWGANRPSNLMQGLTPTSAPPDADDDGIPDARETVLGLDPHDAADASVADAQGLSPLDRYLDDLADALTPCGGGDPEPQPEPEPGSGAGGSDGTGAGGSDEGPGAGGSEPGGVGGSDTTVGAGGSDTTVGTGGSAGTGGTGGSDVTVGAGGSDATGGAGGSDMTGGVGGSDTTVGAGGSDMTGGSDATSGTGGDGDTGGSHPTGGVPLDDILEGGFNCSVSGPQGAGAGLGAGAGWLALLGMALRSRRRRG